MKKNIGIVGMGLIGGSLARAIKKYTEHTVFAMDTDPTVIEKAFECNSMDFVLDETAFVKCEYIIVALYPQATVEYIEKNIKHFKKGTVIIDCAGVKTGVCDRLFRLAHEHSMYFVGGHPMAGTHEWGFDHATAELFKGASMVVCADDNTNTVALKAIEILFLEMGFRGVTVATPREHDEMIAFTSQLAHVVSSAYIKSPLSTKHRGFSAGSFKDLTRVAKLNEVMWAELFIHNKEFLVREIEGITHRLAEYKTAIENDDADTLKRLLQEGTRAKTASEC